MLKETQSQGKVVMKEIDKGGGICIMNTDNYIGEMDTQLRAVFKSSDGTKNRFYIPAKEDSLIKEKKKILNIIKSGVEQKIISKSDAKNHGAKWKTRQTIWFPKLHKGIQNGKLCQPCSPNCV